MNLRDMVKHYSGSAATATPATPATYKGQSSRAVAKVAGVAVASSHKAQSCVAKVAGVAVAEHPDQYKEALQARKGYVRYPSHKYTCGGCQHFTRLNHPHLGNCAVGEAEGICGNWDTDLRNHCDSFKRWSCDRDGVSTQRASVTFDGDERLSERWLWFLSLAHEHGIHPDLISAEFPAAQHRRDVTDPTEHTDDMLRSWMATLCSSARVKQRQNDIDRGQ